MRLGFAIVAVAAASLIAGQVEACTDYKFTPVYAEARIKDPKGVWRKSWIEADGHAIRVETEHRRTPWGRLVVTGDVRSGEAKVFPVKVGGEIPKDAQVTWKTSLRDAIPEFGLTDRFFQVPLDARASNLQDARETTFKGNPCWFGLGLGNSGHFDVIDRSHCVHASGLPLFMKDDKGALTFEVTRLMWRNPGELSPARFRAPRAYPVTDKKPKYLGGYTC